MYEDKKIIILAGPKGAGKTTFALEYLPKEANWGKEGDIVVGLLFVDQFKPRLF